MINVDFENKEYKRLSYIFDIARANKSKEYPKGTILIQVSATHGQTIHLDEAQQVADGSKYGALIVKEPDKYNTKYLYYILEDKMPDIVRWYSSGINLQMDALASAKIPVHIDINTQNAIVDIIGIVEEQARLERKTVELLKKHMHEMQYYMFPQCDSNRPQYRFHPDK